MHDLYLYLYLYFALFLEAARYRACATRGLALRGRVIPDFCAKSAHQATHKS
jgi:hypothetical protein